MSALEVEEAPLVNDSASDQPFASRYPWATHADLFVKNSRWHGARKKIHGLDLGWTLPMMRVCAIVSIVVQVGVLLLTFQYSSCDKASGTAHYPQWIWASLLPALVFKVCVEWNSLKYILGIVDENGVPFKVMGMSLGFVVWLVFYGAMSQVNLADIGSDSLFTGTTMRSLTCKGSQLQEIWEREWKHSLCAKAHIPAPNLLYLVAGVWTFSLVQMLWPVCRTFTWGKKGDYLIPLFRCFGDRDGDMCQDDVFFAAADASGMATIGALMIPSTRSTIHTASQERDAADYAVSLRTEISERIFLSYFGENCVQLNIQGSFYMLVLHLGASKSTQMQALLSLTIGVATSLFKLVEARDVLAATRLPDDNTYRAGELRRLAVWIVVGCALLVLSIVYAVVKVVMAHVCATSLWNLTGCVAE